MIGWNKEFLTIAVLLAAVCCAPANADILGANGSATVVRVSAFDRNSLRFTEGCSGSEPKSISWNDIETVTFQSDCGPAMAEVNAVSPDCPEGSLDVFAIAFKGAADGVIAESVALTNDRVLHLDLFQPWEQAHGPASTVRNISKRKICRQKIPTEYEVPGGFCREARQIAVAFDYGNPLSNKILTNGFSFVLRTVGNPPAGFDIEAFGNEVRSAFQAGITLWTTAIKGVDASPNLQKFLKSRTSTSANGYSLFTPPQVIRLQCPQSATFVVELGFEDEELFPEFPLVLARAKIEGRTIALNMSMKEFDCFRSELKFDAAKQLRFTLDDGCINLVPIMTHELGHAFGLNHFDDDTAHALMDSQFSSDSLVPTKRDVAAFVAILEQSVEGAAPGVLKFVSSAGVRPPADWVPAKRRTR